MSAGTTSLSFSLAKRKSRGYVLRGIGIELAGPRSRERERHTHTKREGVLPVAHMTHERIGICIYSERQRRVDTYVYVHQAVFRHREKKTTKKQRRQRRRRRRRQHSIKPAFISRIRARLSSGYAQLATLILRSSPLLSCLSFFTSCLPPNFHSAGVAFLYTPRVISCMHAIIRLNFFFRACEQCKSSNL